MNMGTEGTLRISELVGPGYDEFWNSKALYRLCKGSKGSKKSKTCALWYIWHMMKYPDANTLVIRKHLEEVRQSCFEELQWAINTLRVDHLWKATVAPLRLTYLPTGQRIIFIGLDKAMKRGSMTVAKGVLCWVWFEEFFEITSEEEFDKLDMSIRGSMPEGSGLWKQITCTFNPWSADCWIKDRFFDNPKPNVFTCTTTFRCNNFLDDVDRQKYLDMYDRSPRLARIICDGEWGIAEGLVYEDWEVQDFDTHEVLLENPQVKPLFGLDFGFAVSYNAFVAGYVDLDRRIIWIFDEMYERGISNLEIAKRINQMGYGKETIIADSAEPKSIYELQEGQIEETFDENGAPVYTRWQLPSIRGAMKGPDSVRNGIRRLQSFHIIVHPRCENFLVEINNYCWDTDKDGNMLDKPIKEYDHCLVAGTQIMTERGPVPIEDVRVGDMVMTHMGYMPVEAVGMTRPHAEIWRMECADGTILEGTGDHPVITTTGLKYLKDVSATDEVLIWKRRSPRTESNPSKKMDMFGEDTPGVPTEPLPSTTGQGSMEQSSSIIDMSGKSTTDLFPKDGTYIISTKILQTTAYPTSDVALPRSTLQNILSAMSAENNADSRCSESAPSRWHVKCGTVLKKGINGTSDMEPNPGSGGSLCSSLANTAARYSRAWLTGPDSALPTVRMLIDTQPDSITRTMFVKSVVKNSCPPNMSTSAPAPAPAVVQTSSCTGITSASMYVPNVEHPSWESPQPNTAVNSALGGLTGANISSGACVLSAEQVLNAINTTAQHVAPAPVVKCTKTSRIEPVFDLTVAVAHDFFANGVITLNCLDATRMGLERYFVRSSGHVAEIKGGAAPSGYKSKRVFSSSK